MRAAGAVFEQRACDELRRAGLTLLARNYTTRYGELDLVMLDRGMVVFVEVRHRLSRSRGDAAASVNYSKQAKLIQTAALWLASHPSYASHTCRFDVVTYDGPADQAIMTWWKQAFDAG
jgi:putative endonuclease